MVIAPEGVSCNLIFRTLLLICGAESHSAPVLGPGSIVDFSRARGGFDAHGDAAKSRGGDGGEKGLNTQKNKYVGYLKCIYLNEAIK